MSLWNFKSEDILDLESWPQERAIIVSRLQLHCRMPNVLCNMIISYSGPVYSDALVALGKMPDLEILINHCKLNDRLSLQSAQSIINLLAKTIGSPPPAVYKRAQIRDIVSGINKFRLYPNRAANLKRCAIFHRILLTYF